MITVTYSSKQMQMGRLGDRFVRTVRLGAEYAWCIRDVTDERYDVQQGFCHADDLPVDVRKAADARHGFIPSYVEWPK